MLYCRERYQIKTTPIPIGIGSIRYRIEWYNGIIPGVPE